MNKTVAVLILVFLLVASIFSFRVLFNAQFRSARASNSVPTICSIVPASVNAYCSTGETCNVAVAVIVQSADFNGVANANVKLRSTFANVAPSTSISNEIGSADFVLSASSAGVATLSANVEGTGIKCTSATVSFNY